MSELVNKIAIGQDVLFCQAPIHSDGDGPASALSIQVARLLDEAICKLLITEGMLLDRRKAFLLACPSLCATE